MPRTPSPLPKSRVVGISLVVALIALPIGGLSLRAVEADEPAKKAQAVTPDARAERAAKGFVRDAGHKPVADATVLVADMQKPAIRVMDKTDAEGRFSIALPEGVDYFRMLVAKEGYGVCCIMSSSEVQAKFGPQEFRLQTASPFVATLVDGGGKPVAGATVRVEAAAFPHANGARYEHYAPEVTAGTPLDAKFVATTDARGAFRLPDLAPDACPKLLVTAPGVGRMRIVRKQPMSVSNHVALFGAVQVKPGEAATITVAPAARVEGRLIARVPGVVLSGRPVHLASVRSHDSHDMANSGQSTTDAEGRFSFDGLFAGKVAVSLGAVPADAPFTFRDVQADAELGETATADITLIPGTLAEGTVTSTDGEPIPDVPVQVCDPATGQCRRAVSTDAKGRYTLRAAPGEQSFSIGAMVPGFSYGAGSNRKVTIPDDATAFTVPPLTLEKSADVKGRIVDGQGKPIAGAKVIGVCDEARCLPLAQPSSKTDAQGRFELGSQPGFGFPIDRASSFQVELADGKKFDLKAVRDRAGEVTLKVATLQDAKVKGPEKVTPDEFAGVVVDADGKPIAGAEVAPFFWVPNYRTRTDDRGRFSFRNKQFAPGDKVVARVRKEGYETQFLLDKVVGEPGLVVVLGNSTYFDGRVLSPDGKPVADAFIRADSGPRRTRENYVISECYTETTSDKDGRYRLYVEPGRYDFQVRVAGVGVARLPKESISADEKKALDITLSPGITFVAKAVDAQTSKPIAGVTLSHWQKPGIEGTSNADGLIEIKDVPPGKYPRFEVKAKGYTRFWSDACQSEWNRYNKNGLRANFQRNFDGLDFEVTPDMKPVTIVLEKGVTIRGYVFDPEGNPVSGATVAPALTGTGNSLTGDTRFSVGTDKAGKFDMLLPASGDAQYGLVAHDGTYQEWRKWANGTLGPVQTKPGQVIDGVELKLSRPGTVTGRVVDAQGKPVSGREVRAEPTARDENRYYDPTTKTADDGTFTLKFVRPGEQYIQVAPFWLLAEQAPEGSSQTVTVKPDKVTSGVELKAGPER